jgi:DNA-binding PadR family transcriptional regulator
MKITPDGIQMEDVPRSTPAPAVVDAEFATVMEERVKSAEPPSRPSGPSPQDVYSVLQSVSRKPRSLDAIKQEVHLGDDDLFTVLGALTKAKLIARGVKQSSEASVFVLTPLGRKIALRFLEAEEKARDELKGRERTALTARKTAPKSRAIKLEKGSSLQDVHTIGGERGSLEEQTPFKDLRPEDVNPQLKGKKSLPKEVLQPMEMRVQSDRGTDTRDATPASDAEKRTQILMERAKKERKEKGKFGVQQTEKPGNDK